MIIVGACCANGGIGFNGKLPWKNSADMKHFRETTMGKTLLVGRKTAEQLPPLKGRKVIVLSRTNGVNLDDYADKDVILIGGAEVWKYALEKDFVDEMIITYIHESYECDTYFPFEAMWGKFTVEKAVYLDDKTRVMYYSKKMN